MESCLEDDILQLLLKKSEAKEDPYSSTKGWNGGNQQRRRQKRRSHHDPSAGFDYGKPSDRMELNAHDEVEEDDEDEDEGTDREMEEADDTDAAQDGDEADGQEQEAEMVDEDSLLDGPKYTSPSKLLALVDHVDGDVDSGEHNDDNDAMMKDQGVEDQHNDESIANASFMTVNLEESFEDEA
jgi:hypothetical protein